MSTGAESTFPRGARALLLVILLLALLLRLAAAMDYGRDWYAPGSFTLINFDEGGSCRAALDGFAYSPLVGWQTLGIATLAGSAPPVDIAGNATAVKRYCHSLGHIQSARIYSAVTGALTVGVLWLLAAMLFPHRPLVAPLSAAMLAVSGWHISESLMGTVDAASTFFIYAFLTAAVAAQRYRGSWHLLAALLLIPAIWTKYWIFAALAGLAWLPPGYLQTLFAGVTRARGLALLLAYAALFGLITNPETPAFLKSALPLLFYAVPPWQRLGNTARFLLLLAPWLAPLAIQSDLFVAFSAGGLEGRFGSDYGAIGWHKWLRNPLNLPIVLLMGLGLPGAWLLWRGARALWQESDVDSAWMVLLPLPVFALYMVFLAPVTYYRHYLPLLPLACLLVAYGASRLAPKLRYPIVAVTLFWQALLALDLVSDYHLDPRRELPDWYASQRPDSVLASFYVSPPPSSGARHGLFRVSYTQGAANRLRGADAVILSENWYDTAFANELNGPLANDPQRLIKTTPDAARFYRSAIAGRHPLLQKSAHLRAPHYMPELIVHYLAYGSFTQFVGDIVILQPRNEQG